jgi:hypothetical protein
MNQCMGGNFTLLHTMLTTALCTLPPTGRYGAASFCRTGSYGMPQFVTNTMRLCTKDAANASYDASVPVRPIYRKEGLPGASTAILQRF